MSITFTPEAVAARARADATSPARLLGVAQVAIETALTLPPEQVHAHLAEALGRIKNPEATA